MSTSSQTALDSSVKKWDEVLGYLEEGGDKTYGFLQLAQSDLHAFSGETVCPYCRKQLETEVGIIAITLQFSRLVNQWEASSGLRSRASLVGQAVPLIARLAFLEFAKIL